MEEKILIVDDDASILALEERILQRGGYEVLIAVNGMQALRTALDENPDLIILDLKLPLVDGFEICDQLKSNEETGEVPVLILSAKGSEEDKVAAIECGASAYLTKPINAKQLITEVKELLSRDKRDDF